MTKYLKLSLYSFLIALVFAGLLYFSASAISPDNDGIPEWDKNLPVLGGYWLFDEKAQDWWYVHSIEEFDADMEGCNECHTGQDAFFEKTWICPWKDGDV